MKFLKTAMVVSFLSLATSVNAAVVNLQTDMTTHGTATINNPNQVTLTPNDNSKAGSIFTNQQYTNISAFTASFDVYLGDDINGADGITFAWTPGNKHTSGGGSMGYANMGGYGIEFDTYSNGAEIDNNSANHIALSGGSFDNPLDINTNVPVLEDGQWHSVEVMFDNGMYSVSFDSNTVLNGQISGYAAFDGYFGFMAATGGAKNLHQVRNFDLTVSAVPEPSTYALMIAGLGLVGFMAARRKKNA